MSPLAVIFDLDGTLIDSEPWHKSAELETFAHFGLEIRVEELMPYTGKILKDMLAGLAPGMTVETFLEVERPILARHIEENIHRFADATRLVESLSVPLAMATSSMRWYVEAMCTRFPELATSFSVRVCQADIQNGKPDPEIMLLAADQLGVDPGACWVIEDSRNGVLSARAAGCYAIGVDRHGEGHLDDVAHRVVRSLDMLIELE